MSTTLAPTANPFDVQRDGADFLIVDTREAAGKCGGGKTVDIAWSRDEAQAVADRLWFAELKATAPIVSQGNRLWNSDLGAYEDVEVVIGRNGQQSAKSYGYSA